MSRFRSPFIDYVRAAAILAMIAYHFAYDLEATHLSSIAIKSPEWEFFRGSIVAAFLFAAGASLKLVHQSKIDWPAFRKRFIRIGGGALLISATTFFAFPNRWIYFGILHSILLASVVVIPFLSRPAWAAGVGILILVAHHGFGIELPWVHLDHKGFDTRHPFPDLGYALLGVAAAKAGIEKIQWPTPNWVVWLSRHSLEIYFAHRIFLWAGTSLLAQLL